MELILESWLLSPPLDEVLSRFEVLYLTPFETSRIMDDNP